MSANLRISSRICSSVSSSPLAPASRSARISSTRRARRCAVLPEAISASTAGVTRAATAAAESPTSAGRTISPWLIGMPPRICGEIFAEPDAHDEVFSLAETSGVAHPLGIGGELAHGLDIGREPGEPMGRPLLAIEQAVDEQALDRHAVAHRGRSRRPAAPRQRRSPPASWRRDRTRLRVGKGVQTSQSSGCRRGRAFMTLSVQCNKASRVPGRQFSGRDNDNRETEEGMRETT